MGKQNAKQRRPREKMLKEEAGWLLEVGWWRSIGKTSAPVQSKIHALHFLLAQFRLNNKSQQQTEELTTFRPQVLQKEQNFNKIWSSVWSFDGTFSQSPADFWSTEQTLFFFFSKVQSSRVIDIIQSACKDQFSSSTRCWQTYLPIGRIILFFLFQ